MHARAVIRKAIVSRLMGATAAELRVYEHPVDPRRSFPALVVEDVSEQQNHPTMPGNGNRLVQRMLLIDVKAELQQVASYADDRDALIAEVESLLMSTPFQGVKNIELMGYMTETMAGERPIAIGRQRFGISYYTTAGNPAAFV